MRRSGCFVDIMDFEERVGMDSRCNVKGCDEQSVLLMPSLSLPRQLCFKHSERYMKKKYPEEHERIRKRM